MKWKCYYKTSRTTKDISKDILDTILNWDYWEFERFMRDFSDLECKCGFCNNHGDIKIPMSEVFNFLRKSRKKYDAKSEERDRINRILKSRSEKYLYEKLYNEIKGIKGGEQLLVKKSFKILRNDNLFEKFLHFDDNKEEFLVSAPWSKKIPQLQDYLRVMISIFGSVKEDGQLQKTSPILDDFYIPQIAKYKNRFIEIYKAFKPKAEKEAEKLERIFDVDKCPTDDPFPTLFTIEQDPDWQLNEEIRAAVLDGMTDDMSPEEKAILVYARMCKLFSFDEGYSFRDHDQGLKINYKHTFSKEHLESLTLNSRLTCYDFTRVYKKIVDDLNESITVELITEDIRCGHFFIGIATKRCQAKLEATKYTGKNDEKITDLLRAKCNTPLEGIYYVSGDKEVLSDAIKVGCAKALEGAQPRVGYLISELMELSTKDDSETAIEGIDLVKSLVDKMKKIQISGNEFTLFFNNTFQRNELLRNSMDYSYVGEVIQKENSKTYKRKIWLRELHPNAENEFPMYLIDTKELEITSVTEQEMRTRFKNGEIVYENRNRPMIGFVLEEN